MQDTNAGQPRRALTNSRILGGLWGAIVGDALGVAGRVRGGEEVCCR